MTHQQIEAFKEKLLSERNKSTHPSRRVTQVSSPLFGALINLLLVILEFAKNHAVNPDGSPIKIKWYDFLFKKELRNFIGSIISMVFEIVQKFK